MSDWTADFAPVPPGPGEHDWRISQPRGAIAECSRCGLQLRAVLSQLQVGHAVAAELVLAGTGARYDVRRHGRCAS